MIISNVNEIHGETHEADYTGSNINKVYWMYQNVFYNADWRHHMLNFYLNI